MSSQHRRWPAKTITGSHSLLSKYSRNLAQASLHHRAGLAYELARTEVELANKARNDFITLMSHELRTPLNAIVGFAHVLEQGGLPAHKNSEYTGYILEAADHLLETVNRILDLSKIQSGRMALSREPVDIEAVIASAVGMAEKRIRESAISITIEPLALSEPVMADGSRIKELLINLLSNAAKFTPDGGQISLSASTDEGFLSLTVADTGIGMTPTEIEAALKPFGQAHMASDRHHQGIGLGLPIAAAIAKLHGGYLKLSSIPGQGTIATALLAIAENPSGHEQRG